MVTRGHSRSVFNNYATICLSEDTELWPEIESAIRRERNSYYLCHVLPRLVAFLLILAILVAMVVYMLYTHKII